MKLSEQLKLAVEIAISAHDGQFDKFNGRPYLEHPFRVMNAGHTLKEKIVGVLHDVVEDTYWTPNKLKDKGFSQEIVEAVDAISKRDKEAYDDYMRRVLNNPIAVRVKMNDLSDNMDIRRWNEVQEKDIPRLQKYLSAYKQLTEIEEKE